MGRYYSGDIDGKFWFAVQSSDDADFFGVVGETPDYLNYYFDEDNLEDVKIGIEKCKSELGEYKEKIDEYFKDRGGYNNDDMAKELSVSTKEVKRLLVWYARLELGQKIFKCIEKIGSCCFDAEL